MSIMTNNNEFDGGLQTLPTSWKEVFNCQKLFPMSFNPCIEKVKDLGYQYMAFNGLVFNVYKAINPSDYIMKDTHLQ